MTDSISIDNAFYKCFSTIPQDIQSSIKDKRKQFFDFLPPRNSDPFFISPTAFNEGFNIISSLNNHKTVEPNSIPT